jgi:hypothetical protein
MQGAGREGRGGRERLGGLGSRDLGSRDEKLELVDPPFFRQIQVKET